MGGTNLTRDSHSTNNTFTISEPDNSQYQLNVISFSRSHSFIVGPAMELSLPRNFSVEVNALHRNLRSTQNVISFSRSHSFIVGPAMELSLPRNFSVEVNALHRNLRSTQVVTSLFPN